MGQAKQCGGVKRHMIYEPSSPDNSKPGCSMSQIVGLHNNSYKPITNMAWVRVQLCKLQKGCTRLAATRDKVYQLLAHGRRFSLGTPASSTAKTGRHDIAEILLKVAFSTKKKSIHTCIYWRCCETSVLSNCLLNKKIFSKYALTVIHIGFLT